MAKNFNELRAKMTPSARRRSDKLFRKFTAEIELAKQLSSLRRQLREQLKHVNELWDAHNKKWTCKIDGTCLLRARFQGATWALQEAIEICGGRKEYNPEPFN